LESYKTPARISVPPKNQEPPSSDTDEAVVKRSMTFYLAEAGRTVRPYGELKVISAGVLPNGSLSILRGLYRTLATAPNQRGAPQEEEAWAQSGTQPSKVGIHAGM